ncbi:MAG: hypothetical protein ABI330_01555 [Caldimonas sp.]
MATLTTAVVVASAGDLSMTPGVPISFSVTWGSNISPFRWSRVWAAIESAGDGDTAQSVTIESEGSTWNLSSPASTANQVTLRGEGQSGAPVVARIQVLSSQVDTF